MRLKALATLLARNWRLKLSALGLAIFLWALVQVDGSGLRTVSVPVSVQLNEPGWILVGQPSPPAVEVRFSGPAREVFRLGFEGSGLTIPIGQVASGDTVVVIQAGWVPTQGFTGVQVEEIVPSTVRLRLEREETKIVPVRIATRGQIPADLALTRPLGLSPDVVRATGPASLIEQLDSLDIVPVDLSEATLDGGLEATIDVEGFGGLTVVPDRVSLRTPVEEAVRRVLAGVPVEASGPTPGTVVEVDPATVEMVLEGARTRVGAVDPQGLRVFVPLYALQGLGPTEERRVPVAVEGVPSFVNWQLQVDSVTVRRPAQ